MCCSCCSKPQSRPALNHNDLAKYFPKKSDLSEPGRIDIDYGNISNPPAIPDPLDFSEIIIGQYDDGIYDGGT